MALLDLISKKKWKEALSDADIAAFARYVVDPDTPDYQLAAMLMAIRLNGMDERETASLTMAMAQSGDMLSPQVGGIPVDKHSTGGVGDTTTLVLTPLVAACGGKVVKMSGRGLGHTGGTVDKLSSIPGFQTELPEEDFLRIAREVGCCVVGQSGELAPADKRLYALRDVTSTVDAVPLIASSIMSKKLAGGALGIVLDVKVGSGALMKTLDECLSLARLMCEIGRRNGRQMAALITGMDEPLGSHVGNALEVKEAIDVLAGRTRGPLLSVSLDLAAQMLLLGGQAKEQEEAKRMLENALQSGQGLKKFADMIAAQGGDPRVCENTSLLPQAPLQSPLYAQQSGILHHVDTEKAGLAALALGAGRARKEDQIDLSVGYVLHKRIGETIEKGEEIARFYHKDEPSFLEGSQMLLSALTISQSVPTKQALVRARIAPDGKETIT